MINSKVTRIFLVRHGETEWNRRRIFRGTHDVSLNDNGRVQARLLGRALKDRRITAAYVSPLARAVETAEIALGRIGAKIVPDERVKDFCYGDWQGLEEAEVFQKAFSAMKEIVVKN